MKRSAGNPPNQVTALLLPPVLCLLLALIGLCGTTWAWFSSLHAQPTAPIRCADYRLLIRVRHGETELAVTDNTCRLEAGGLFSVSLTASGTASTGFCRIVFSRDGGNTWMKTAQIRPGETLVFTLQTTAATEIVFQPQWGSSAGSPLPDISAGDVLMP